MFFSRYINRDEANQAHRNLSNIVSKTIAEGVFDIDRGTPKTVNDYQAREAVHLFENRTELPWSVRERSHLRFGLDKAGIDNDEEFDACLSRLAASTHDQVQDYRRAIKKIKLLNNDDVSTPLIALAPKHIQQKEHDAWQMSGAVELPPAGLIEWVRSASPDDWHQVIPDFCKNDDVMPEINRIIANPKCDLMTALTVLSYAEIWLFARPETDQHFPKRVALIDRVYKNLGKGFYKSHEFMLSDDVSTFLIAQDNQNDQTRAMLRQRGWVLPKFGQLDFGQKAPKSVFQYLPDPGTLMYTLEHFTKMKELLNSGLVRD